MMEFFTVEEIADLTKCKVYTVSGWLKEGKVKYKEVGRKKVVPRGELFSTFLYKRFKKAGIKPKPLLERVCRYPNIVCQYAFANVEGDEVTRYCQIKEKCIYEEEGVECKHCNATTTHLGTELCDACWHLERSVRSLVKRKGRVHAEKVLDLLLFTNKEKE